MKVTLNIKGESIQIDTEQEVIEPNTQKYSPLSDKKWFNFCKQHNFNPWETEGKIYTLYLDMCSEGML